MSCMHHLDSPPPPPNLNVERATDFRTCEITVRSDDRLGERGQANQVNIEIGGKGGKGGGCEVVMNFPCRIRVSPFSGETLNDRSEILKEKDRFLKFGNVFLRFPSARSPI